MSVKTKKAFCIAWSILFVFTMVITFMPFEAHAALTDPMEVNPANAIRVDSLPTASASLVGKYYDVKGNVYQCIDKSSSYSQLSSSMYVSSGTIRIKYGLVYNTILDGASNNYVRIYAEGAYEPIVVMVEFSNGYSIFLQDDGIYLGIVNSSGIQSVKYQTSYPANQILTASIPVSFASNNKVVNVPGNNVTASKIQYSASGYEWELIHTHNLVEYTLEDPTCTEEGLASIGCTYCEVLDIYLDSYPIPATGHNYFEVNRHTECETITVNEACVCGLTRTNTLPGSGHQYNSVYTPGSSNILGYTTYTCSGCNDSYVIYDEWDCDVNGHGWAESSRTQRCTDTIVHYYCPRCEVTKQETIAGGLGHDLYESSSSGNCETRSVKYSCQRSGCSYSKTQTEKRSHAYSKIKTEGSCDNALVTYSCSTCGDTYTKTTIGAHSWQETSRTDATCTLQGFVTSTCTACGAVNTETIKVKGHVNMLEQYEENGYRVERYTCSVCGNVEEHRTALPQAPDVGVEDVSNFILTFFGSLASFILYILGNVSFLGITGLDLLGILALVVFVVLIRRITKGGD